MRFPQQIGLAELYYSKPRFSQQYLAKIAKRVITFYPRNFLEFSVLGPLESSKKVDKSDVSRIGNSLRRKYDLDNIVIVSSGIGYRGEGPTFDKIGEAFIEEKLVIYGEKRRLREMSLDVAHEIGHLYGLVHVSDEAVKRVAKIDEEDADLLLILGLVRTQGIKELNKRFARISNVLKDEIGYIMYDGSHAKKQSFSARDFRDLQRQMRARK